MQVRALSFAGVVLCLLALFLMARRVNVHGWMWWLIGLALVTTVIFLVKVLRKEIRAPLAKRTFGLKEARKFAERPSVTDEDCRSYMEKCRLRGGKITLRNDFLHAQDACDAAKALARCRLEQAAARVAKTDVGTEEGEAAARELDEAQENFEDQFRIAAKLQKLVDRFIPPTF